MAKELHRRSSTGFLIRLWYRLGMLFGMLIGWQQKPRFSVLLDLSFVSYMLRKNRLAKKNNTERYIRTFRHTYNKWSILIIQYKSTLNLHLLYMNIYKYIQLSNLIYIYIYIYYIYTIYILYIYILYIYILYIYILYIYMDCNNQLGW